MEDELVELVMDDTRERMAQAIDHVKVEFATVRTGRASPSLVENFLIDYYGTETPLKSLANFSVPEPRLLVSRPLTRERWPPLKKPSPTPTWDSTHPMTDRDPTDLSFIDRGATQRFREDRANQGRRWQGCVTRCASTRTPRTRKLREGSRLVQRRGRAARKDSRQDHPGCGRCGRRAAASKRAGTLRCLTTTTPIRRANR